MSIENEADDIKITFEECANCRAIYNGVNSIIAHIQLSEGNVSSQKRLPKILNTVISNAHSIHLCSNCSLSFVDFRKNYKIFNQRTSDKSAISRILTTRLSEKNNNPTETVTDDALECDSNLQVAVNISGLTPRELISNNVNLATVEIFLRKCKANEVQKDTRTKCLTRIQKFSSSRSSRKVSRTEFQRHLNKVKDHTTSKSKKIVTTTKKCDECGKSFRSLNGLNQHVTRLHSKERTINSSFKCNYCVGKTFQDIFILRGHLKELHPDTNESKAAGKNADFNRKVEILLQKNGAKAKLLKQFNKNRNKCFLCDDYINQSPFKCTLEFHIERKHFAKEFPEFALLECEMCGKTFSSNRDLTRHYIRHTAINIDEKFDCELCGKKFRQKPNLDTHRSFVHGQKKRKKFPCGKCPRYFYCRSNTDHHWITVHKVPAKFTCEICKKGFLRSETARRHNTKNHNVPKFILTQDKGKQTTCDLDLTKCYCDIDKLYTCPVCEMKFGRKDHFARHLSKHHEISMFVVRNKNGKLKCSMCAVTTLTKEELVIHLRTHLKYNDRQSNFPVSQEPLFQCEFCRKVIKRHTFRKHWKSHKESSKMNWKKRFNSGMIIKKSGILLSVAGESHNEKTSNRNQSLERGVKNAPRKDESKNRHGCEFCGRRFASNGILTRHKNAKHTKQNRFTCSFCKMKFAYASYLLYHIRNKHGSKKPIMCPFENCLATYSKETDLQRHQQSRHIMEKNDPPGNSFNIKTARQIIGDKTKPVPRHENSAKEIVKKTKNATVKVYAAKLKEPVKRLLRLCPHENCNKIFYWKKVLTRHIRRVHNENSN